MKHQGKKRRLKQNGGFGSGSIRTNRQPIRTNRSRQIVSVFGLFVLIGPSDWEDHSKSKEGAARYRVHNLPNGSSCSGLYELGIAIESTRPGRNTRTKLNRDNVIPVYLGQADNVRTRLQHYGREGSHLENGKKSSGLLKDSSVGPGSGLFSGIFSRGCSIVYRWAPMKSKSEAERTEAQLLEIFDYAWNKGSNGNRRPNDILQKLDRSRRPWQNASFFAIREKLRALGQKKYGIKIEDCGELQFEKESRKWPPEGTDDIFSRIFRIGKLRPTFVSQRRAFSEDNDSKRCGVALGQGSVCRALPVEGRKRCAEHKGMKVNGFPIKADVIVESGKCHDFEHLICGVTLHDGAVCGRPPVHGRKRCEEHKGRRKIKSAAFSDCAVSIVNNNNMEVVCGILLQDGSPCTRKPAEGRKRCEQHKGLRLALLKSNLPESDLLNPLV